MNTTIIAQATEMTKDPNYAAFVEWLDGFNAYADGAQLGDMQTEQQRKGWIAAWHAQAEAECPAIDPDSILYVEELEDLQDDMLDREDWARGWW